MNSSLDDMDGVIKRMYASIVEDMAGTFDPDPYPRRAKYEEVPLSPKKLAKLEAAEELLSKHGALIEESFKRTRTKKTWLETEEEWYARLATLPEHRSDWIKQQLAKGKKPDMWMPLYDYDYFEAVGRQEFPMWRYGRGA